MSRASAPRHRALEFYAGIGGLQLAAYRSTAAVEVCAAYDWDQSAIRAYAHNYGQHHPVHRADISQLTADDLSKHNADVWLMSPPCQPYTVLNENAKGHTDPRATSFHHLFFTLLPQLQPQYLLIENVAGFKGSVTQAQVLEVLAANGYHVREFLLSPLQFGIPNSRKRYYLVARRNFPLSKQLPRELELWKDPRSTTGVLSSSVLDVHDSASLSSGSHSEDSALASLLFEFLDEDQDEVNSEAQQCAVSDKVLYKWAHEFDIVLPSAQRTCCFTRGYTHLAQGSGSVLQQNTELDTSTTFREFMAARPNQREAAIEILRPLRLRYFTPSELLRLLCFLPPRSASSSSPEVDHNGQSGSPLSSFSWPSDISRKTKYKLLGNSVNVLVVTRLVDFLFADEPDTASHES